MQHLFQNDYSFSLILFRFVTYNAMSNKYIIHFVLLHDTCHVINIFFKIIYVQCSDGTLLQQRRLITFRNKTLIENNKKS